MAKINIEISDQEHQKMKILAAIQGISLKDFAQSAIRDKINKLSGPTATSDEETSANLVALFKSLEKDSTQDNGDA